MKRLNRIGLVPPVLALIASLVFASSGYAADLGPYASCFLDAAKTYGRDPMLYLAITQVESSGCRNLINVNSNGTRDIGCMQINSSQFPFLEKYGITEDRLLRDPCMNIHVGAWLLETKIRKYGATWEAVGAFNAACTKLKGDACIAARRTYISKVLDAYERYTAIQAHKDTNAHAQPDRPAMRISGD